jgi:hypothetical protein
VGALYLTLPESTIDELELAEFCEPEDVAAATNIPVRTERMY